jgi:hypothetical protein
VDGRDKPGHDENGAFSKLTFASFGYLSVHAYSRA